MNTDQPSLSTDPYRKPAGPPPTITDNRPVISMVLGIVATVLCCVPLVGPTCGTVAIVLFAKFNGDWHRSQQTLPGRGMAVAGLVTGIIGAALGLIYLLYWLVAGLIIGLPFSWLLMH